MNTRALALVASLCSGGCCLSTHPVPLDAGDTSVADASEDSARDVPPDPMEDRRHDVVFEFDPDRIVDEGCDGGPPTTNFTCDLTNPASCGPGMACYPYIIYPPDPCSNEEYGSVCSPSGSGTESTPCLSAGDCAAGYACFVTGQGTQCLFLCSLAGGSPTCPSGLICMPTDNPETGACL